MVRLYLCLCLLFTDTSALLTPRRSLFLAHFVGALPKHVPLRAFPLKLHRRPQVFGGEATPSFGGRSGLHVGQREAPFLVVPQEGGAARAPPAVFGHVARPCRPPVAFLALPQHVSLERNGRGVNLQVRSFRSGSGHCITSSTGGCTTTTCDFIAIRTVLLIMALVLASNIAAVAAATTAPTTATVAITVAL